MEGRVVEEEVEGYQGAWKVCEVALLGETRSGEGRSSKREGGSGRWRWTTHPNPLCQRRRKVLDGVYLQKVD